jgi:hypothetical protein
MEDLFKEHFGAFLATIITGFGGWFFGRKKANVDVEGVQIENFDKGLLYYQKLVDDLGVRLERSILALQNSEIEKQVVIQKFTEATKNIHELEIKVEKLTDELQKYKQLNGKI